ncbi:AGE family epimerase/isomerase [Frateuria aurantia]|uniref:N-acyl-D-glucosamine 2-epimerase n=1 Tax=Frateuria aurantia (strain ATCC 33424 / DSM 6220 / KCTC 2777 / LMG 1558 / NBRC 3245 / NCIMB 13370) TaxID=767434 RepID=H8L095_FRAAD|nr:AGE family epimerase/isomerase [Frateuria aurantia]AFC87133.1 N-acyl-D-glucosamine 2-epimerase [Frateuria aurantia DSM 6220]
MAEHGRETTLLRGDWLRSRAHRDWLDVQGQRLLDFSKQAAVPQGFAALDGHGRLSEDAGADTILTARMTHCYAIAALRGLPGCAPLAAHGVHALLGPLRDADHGGWHESQQAAEQKGGRKQAYLHAFVGLAASSAVVAGIEQADLLLELATEVLATRFWDQDEGVFLESFALDWSDLEAYRGANANMHSVESCLALADVTGDPVWRRRALRVVERIIHTEAGKRGHAVAEHFDPAWQLLPDYHKDRPTDDLRPYGMTPGHFVEWSHLLLKLEAALLRESGEAPDWLLDDARQLFETGMRCGWGADGSPGMLYTVDWDLEPVVHNRPHWCQAEALVAAASLWQRTGQPVYQQWYRDIWNYVDRHMIDREHGSWKQELDADQQLSADIYPGKADLYHAWQATMAPRLPLAPSMATAVAAQAESF